MRDNFTFEGRHILRDMGCEYYASDPRPLSPAAKRNEYQIGGRSGTVIYPGGIYQPITQSGMIVSRDGEEGEAALPRLRRVADWLRSPANGRGRLIFDSRPEVYREAQIDAASALSYGKWPGGALNVTWTMQPIARAVSESYQSMTVSARMTALVLLHATQLPAPLTIDVTNTGGSVMTACELAIGDACIRLSGMALCTGERLRVSGEDGQAGVTILDTQGAVRDAACHVAAWADPLALPGTRLTVTQEGAEQASIAVRARGCYL